MKSKFRIQYSYFYFIGIGLVIYSLLLSSYPYVFSLFLPIPSVMGMQILGFLSFTVLSFLFKNSLIPLPKNIVYLFFIQIIIWIGYVGLHRDTTYFTRITYLINTILSLTCLYNCKNGIKGFLRNYNYWLTFMALCGTVMFFIILFTGFRPLFEFSEQDGRIGYFYGLTTTNTLLGNIIRYSGFFDEPGQMAFWGMWGLIFNYFFFKNKKVEKLLTFTLIFTFSIAYYIQIFFYYIFFKVKEVKSVIVISIILLVLGGGIYSTKGTNLDLYKLTLYRFEINSSGEMQGDNRSDLTNKAKRVFFKYPLFGAGALNATSNMDYMGDNPYTLLAYDGIIGYINTYLPLLFLFTILYKNSDMNKALFVIFLGYAQRPFSPYFISPFILYSFVILAYLKFYAKNNCNNSMFQC